MVVTIKMELVVPQETRKNTQVNALIRLLESRTIKHTNIVFCLYIQISDYHLQSSLFDQLFMN